MDKDKKLLKWLVIISLALNLFIYYRLGEVRTQIQTLNDYLNQTDASIQYSISSAIERINQIQNDSNWISSLEFKPNRKESTPQEIHLDSEWTFREIEKNASIYFLYRIKDDENWQKEKAIAKGGSLYSAPLVLNPQKRYEYQIVVEGNTLRAGEIKDIPAKYYQFPHLVVQGKGNSSAEGRMLTFSAEFSQRVPVYFDFYKVKEAHIKIQRKGKDDQIIPLKESPIGKDDYVPNIYKLDTNMDPDIISIVLEVEYNDGTVDQGEIFPNDIYMQNLNNYLK